ncbi:MAG: undecaprenyl diphosphate synthase family protein, partial [Ancrocorticia sp.]|nr:undecaprenyl diphosphate synthase family protein [Ancrocorticia sp.]
MEHIQPPAHPSGAVAPKLAQVPHHVAVVMDGNGRWANTRGLPRTDGHREGEATLMDVIAGALEIGVSELSAYAFSTENWKRSPAEVRYILGFSRQILREQR